MMSKTSTKKYTKKQILESIKWWQKQLKAGNYKRVNENINPDGSLVDPTPRQLYDFLKNCKATMPVALFTPDDQTFNIGCHLGTGVGPVSKCQPFIGHTYLDDDDDEAEDVEFYNPYVSVKQLMDGIKSEIFARNKELADVPMYAEMGPGNVFTISDVTCDRHQVTISLEDTY